MSTRNFGFFLLRVLEYVIRDLFYSGLLGLGSLGYH